MILDQKFHVSVRLFPNVFKADFRKIGFKPFFRVPKEQLTALPALEKV